MSGKVSFSEPRLKIRFLKKFKIGCEDSCWPWKSCIGDTGYGILFINGKKRSASRLSYQFFYGDFDQKMWVLHKCDNRMCVNPYHLELGDNKSNMAQCVARGRHGQLKKKRCLRGHLFSKKNTKVYVHTLHGGKFRNCIKCRKSRLNTKKDEI